MPYPEILFSHDIRQRSNTWHPLTATIGSPSLKEPIEVTLLGILRIITKPAKSMPVSTIILKHLKIGIDFALHRLLFV